MPEEYFFEGSDIRTSELNDDLEMEFAEESSKPRNFLQYLFDKQKEKEHEQHLRFFQLLKSKNVAEIQEYLKRQRLTLSDEYQMIVFLVMELDEEDVAERIICAYVRRYGLQTQRAKQLLWDLRLESALKVLPRETDVILYDKTSTDDRLSDGFMMLSDNATGNYLFLN